MTTDQSTDYEHNKGLELLGNTGNPAYDTSGCPETDRGNWMQLGDGRIFYPLDPRPEEVFIEDIARSLSRTMRYNGHSDEPVSVAQHCVQCVFLGELDNLNDYWLLALLLHDAPEAFTGDMIRPLKMHMPDFRKMEQNIEHAVRAGLDIPSCPHEVIKRYDNLAWAWEKRDLFPSARWWPGTVPVPMGLHVMTSWSMEFSSTAFLGTHRRLLKSLADEEAKADDVWENDEDFWDTHRDNRDWRAL